jgi:hypothetical protein
MDDESARRFAFSQKTSVSGNGMKKEVGAGTLNGVRLAPFRLAMLIQAVKESRAHGEQSRGERTNTGQGRGSVSVRAAGRKGCIAKSTVIRLPNGCQNGGYFGNRSGI